MRLSGGETALDEAPSSTVAYEDVTSLQSAVLMNWRSNQVRNLRGRRRARTAPGGAPFLGTANAPEVSVALDLHNPALHPRQLVYDARRNGLWFWTSTQDRGTTFENRVYLYDLTTRQLQSWPLYA